MVRSSNRSTEYKAVARDQRNTNGELASDFHRQRCNWPCHTQRQTKSALRCCDQQECPIREPAMRHVSPLAEHPAVVLAAVKDAGRR